VTEKKEREPAPDERRGGEERELVGHAAHSTAGRRRIGYLRRVNGVVAASGLEAVTFDVTHTLLECPSLGEQYAAVLARHGIEVEARDVETAIPLVWQELSASAEPSRDRFASHPRGARGFWQRFVERTCALVGAERPSRFAAAELYDRFARAEAWKVADGAPAMLLDLRRRGLKLAVISNWDERLPTLLDRLGLAPLFDATIVSALVGVEKPHPRIFDTALAALGVAPERALHVGDSRIDDFEGAQAAGMRALLLSRRGDGDLSQLSDLPAILDGAGSTEAAAG
jgi:putative hydrolase of the HAD superfamily